MARLLLLTVVVWSGVGRGINSSTVVLHWRYSLTELYQSDWITIMHIYTVYTRFVSKKYPFLDRIPSYCTYTSCWTKVLTTSVLDPSKESCGYFYWSYKPTYWSAMLDLFSKSNPKKHSAIVMMISFVNCQEQQTENLVKLQMKW